MILQCKRNRTKEQGLLTVPYRDLRKMILRHLNTENIQHFSYETTTGVITYNKCGKKILNNLIAVCRISNLKELEEAIKGLCYIIKSFSDGGFVDATAAKLMDITSINLCDQPIFKLPNFTHEPIFEMPQNTITTPATQLTAPGMIEFLLKKAGFKDMQEAISKLKEEQTNVASLKLQLLGLKRRLETKSY